MKQIKSLRGIPDMHAGGKGETEDEVGGGRRSNKDKYSGGKKRGGIKGSFSDVKDGWEKMMWPRFPLHLTQRCDRWLNPVPY